MARKQSRYVATRGIEGKLNTEQNPPRESDVYQTQDDKRETAEVEMKKEPVPRFGRGTPRLREPITLSSTGKQPLAIDWDGFNKWVTAQYSRTHAHSLYNYAKKYHQAVLDTKQAAQLRVLTPDCQRMAMQSLAALSKFLGVYDNWQTVKKQSGLKWQRRGAVSFVHALLNQEAANAIPWLKVVWYGKWSCGNVCLID